MTPRFDSLEAEVIVAHTAGDGSRLARLYGDAADMFAAAGDIDSACFFYTQAYIYALEQGGQDAGRYAAFLKENARL